MNSAIISISGYDGTKEYLEIFQSSWCSQSPNKVHKGEIKEMRKICFTSYLYWNKAYSFNKMCNKSIYCYLLNNQKRMAGHRVHYFCSNKSSPQVITAALIWRTVHKLAIQLFIEKRKQHLKGNSDNRNGILLIKHLLNGKWPGSYVALFYFT